LNSSCKILVVNYIFESWILFVLINPDILIWTILWRIGSQKVSWIERIRSSLFNMNCDWMISFGKGEDKT